MNDIVVMLKTDQGLIGYAGAADATIARLHNCVLFLILYSYGVVSKHFN